MLFSGQKGSSLLKTTQHSSFLGRKERGRREGGRREAEGGREGRGKEERRREEEGREEGSLCFFLVGFQLLLFNAFVLLFLSSVFRL